MHIYLEQRKRNLCVHSKQQISSSVSTTLFSGLTLEEYANISQVHCTTIHSQPCDDCTGLYTVAQEVLENGYAILSQVYRKAFPAKLYKADIAKRLLLQMPLVAIRAGDVKSGVSVVYLLEHIPGVNYIKLQQFINRLIVKEGNTVTLGKEMLASLLGLATSDRERQLMRYTAYKASGLSKSAARNRFGFQDITKCCSAVESAIEEVKNIRETIDQLAHVKEKAVLSALGVQLSDSSSSDDSSLEEGGYQEAPQEIDITRLIPLAKSSDFNCFEIIGKLEENSQDEELHRITVLHQRRHELGFTPTEISKLELSFAALQNDIQNSGISKRAVRAINGDIVTDSESDDSTQYVTLRDVFTPTGLLLVKKRRKTIKRRAQRLKVKSVVEHNVLSRRRSQLVRGILADHPDIGQEIEDFVKDRGVGADAWRRTGILTFDGNANVKQKVTYERIRQHLQYRYGRKFSYGTVVQLCVACNKRRRSAARYHGVARVTTRRARKGFQLKYNPDKHWSAAFYKALNYLHRTDGARILNINRDDASGYRLDTLTTHKQHATPTVHGHEILTTHSDYVNRYPSVLQTSSYNFSGTKSTGELCAGVVKAVPLHEKNPHQHAADLEMLAEKPELYPAFHNSVTESVKPIDCIRVDGGMDEGPSHEEVQFVWTELHLKHKKIATIVTTRSAGSSYMNRVELQNGCLSLGHSNLFIQSTLNGSCFQPGSSSVDQERLKKNLDTAIDVYINRVDGSPCGDTQIRLYKGIQDKQFLRRRPLLLLFLRGSKQKKVELRNEHPELYHHFEMVWNLRNRHMVPNLPSNYVFFLRCCYLTVCCHPECQQGPPSIPLTWFEGGPPLTCIPFPVPDPSRPWGSSTCKDCKGVCGGHYLPMDQLLAADHESHLEPPSLVLKQWFNKLKGKEPCATAIDAVAEKVLLPPEEVQFWLEHLKTVAENRKQGAKKAAATRRTSNKSVSSEYYCSVCSQKFLEETEEPELWIQCERCDAWLHWDCAGILEEPEHFFCYPCTCND